MIEELRQSLGKGDKCAANMTDLSKAFDYFLDEFFIVKVHSCS